VPSRTIIYGDIVESSARRRLEESSREYVDLFSWRDNSEVVELGDKPAVVFVDLDNPQYSQPEFLAAIAISNKKGKLIGKAKGLTADETLRLSRLGVCEILKPDQCLERLEKLLSEIENVQEAEKNLPTRANIHALIGVSSQMMDIRETIKLLSEVDFPSALILGDTGTGKGIVSQILHHSGSRSQHNLVEVNCYSIPDELFETELFGHVKGAFTDAKADKAGLFEYAQDGTLFLDEVGNLSASAQAKLLKVLEDKKLRKLGAVSETDVNVRVVAATNLNLGDAVANGTFREDLFFRLNLLTIEIPPLRERIEDVPELLEYYLGYYATNYRKPGIRFTDKAIAKAQQYHWPGNVRELCNVVERAILFNKSGIIKPADLNVVISNSRISIRDRQHISINVPPQGISLQDIEVTVVKQVLNMCEWNKSAAAEFLKISRPRLRRIIESAGLERNRRKN